MCYVCVYVCVCVCLCVCVCVRVCSHGATTRSLRKAWFSKYTIFYHYGKHSFPNVRYFLYKLSACLDNLRMNPSTLGRALLDRVSGISATQHHLFLALQLFQFFIVIVNYEDTIIPFLRQLLSWAKNVYAKLFTRLRKHHC